VILAVKGRMPAFASLSRAPLLGAPVRADVWPPFARLFEVLAPTGGGSADTRYSELGYQAGVIRVPRRSHAERLPAAQD
jgi:hypothetical protein